MSGKNSEEYVTYHGKKIFVSDRKLDLGGDIFRLSELEGLETLTTLRELHHYGNDLNASSIASETKPLMILTVLLISTALGQRSPG